MSMRISTTTLESYRLWSEQDWMAEEALIATITGVFVPTHKVLVGQAFGHVLEDPTPYQVEGGYRYGDFTFSEETMAPALALFDRRGVFEAKATKEYGNCTVVAKADQLLGTELIENKTTLSTFAFDKYATSYQWRFMVDIFEPSQVTYHVFCLSEDRDGVSEDRDGTTITLRSIESFHLYPYAALHGDCCDLLRQFVNYVTARGLDGLLRERQQMAEVA